MRSIPFAIACTTILCLFQHAQAQTELEAYLFSRTTVTGSARAQGMAGAFSAVGADMTAATLNPAGLALYRRSEFTLTPAYRVANTDADFLDGNSSNSTNNFTLNGFSLAFSNPRYNRRGELVEKGLKSFTFAFGYNQIENFAQKARATGFNERSSITDVFADRAQGTPVNDLVDGFGDPFAILAWDAFAINPLFEQDDQYFPAVNGGDIQQTVELIESGRINEWFISLAGNVSDVFYIGATVGIRSLRYERELALIEEDINNVHNDFFDDPNQGLIFPMNRLEYNNNFLTEGSGVNGQLGILIRPSDAFRFGISIQSPTYYTLTDFFGESDTRLEHDFVIDLNTGQDTVAVGSLGAGEFAYQLTTPFRATAGAMYLIGKKGFVSLDIDLTNYTNAEFESDLPVTDPNFYAYDIENRNINELFDMALNYRLGAEFRFDALRVRGGAALFSSGLTEEAKAYQDAGLVSQSIDNDRMLYSLGLGFRQPKYFMDVSFIYQDQDEKLSPYGLGSSSVFSPTLVTNKKTSRVAFTLGLNF